MSSNYFLIFYLFVTHVFRNIILINLFFFFILLEEINKEAVNILEERRFKRGCQVEDMSIGTLQSEIIIRGFWFIVFCSFDFSTWLCLEILCLYIHALISCIDKQLFLAVIANINSHPMFLRIPVFFKIFYHYCIFCIFFSFCWSDFFFFLIHEVFSSVFKNWYRRERIALSDRVWFPIIPPSPPSNML